jgi:hypothetical protein
MPIGVCHLLLALVRALRQKIVIVVEERENTSSLREVEQFFRSSPWRTCGSCVSLSPQLERFQGGVVKRGPWEGTSCHVGERGSGDVVARGMQVGGGPWGGLMTRPCVIF